jgi:hypothetical protein
MNRPEQNLQIAVVDFLRLALVPPATFWATPNGGLRTPREASLMKATGTRAGVPDLWIMWPGNLGGVELKAPKGRLSPEQIEWRGITETNLHRWACCRSVGEVITTLETWGVPFRGRIAA